ncbi:MAG: hypothetical protein H7281_15360 [Bacteriovorax sp.]|nr:hypothetical protein [Bacteriovorax sp.]
MTNYELLCEKIENLEQLVIDFKSLAEDIKKSNLTEILHGSTPIIADQILSEDLMYADALKFVVEHKSASISLLQKKFGIGYQRASMLISKLETRGAIGPVNGSMPRKVLLFKSR